MLKSFTCILLALLITLSAFDIQVTQHKAQVAKASPIIADDLIQHCDFVYFIHPVQCKDESGFTYKVNFNTNTYIAACQIGLSGYVKTTTVAASLLCAFLFPDKPAKQITSNYFCLSFTTVKVALHSLCSVYRI